MELYINSYGASLQVENRMFVLYHDGQKRMLDPQKIKSIHVSRGAMMSSDAIILAIEHEIDVLFLDTTGQPRGRIWSNQFGSISTIRRNQAEFIYTKHAVEWTKEIIMKKFDNQIALLYALATRPEQTEDWLRNSDFARTINAIADYKQKIKSVEGLFISDVASALRGWEGASTRRYFAMYSKLLPEQYQFEERTQHPARDMVNAMLNYGYGILYGKIEGALIKAGVDPYLGVFHRENYNRPVLVFDIIELFRIWVDYVVADLCLQQVVCEEWFRVELDVYWLEHPGKRVLIQSFADYLDEIIEMENRSLSRNNYIQQYAYQLARMFENFQAERL